jgi:hypothetical protein
MVCLLGKGVFLALLEPFFFPFGAFSCLGLFAYFFLPLHTFLPTPLFSASWVRKLTTTRPDCVFTNVFRTHALSTFLSSISLIFSVSCQMLGSLRLLLSL